MLFVDWFRRKETFKSESMVLRLSISSEKTTITEVDTNVITVVRGLSSFKNSNKVLRTGQWISDSMLVLRFYHRNISAT